ncbi:hypothetical protein BN874_2040003 [Candidatus Contendobacter odensis Run_B_J11]|uniref:Uncharacterized protein n=1 Tax=Candidatus Contendobacter odensis Run_B_J11 TaxID=1400861 RepID=A0A7U7GBF1_9GAMM|nr:hypothetical protein BN874_2040003 [Candidatus Contendobacter odensis Run_B_J11]
MILELPTQTFTLMIEGFIQMTKKVKPIDDERGIRKYGLGRIDKSLPHIRAEYFNSFTPRCSTILKIFN